MMNMRRLLAGAAVLAAIGTASAGQAAQGLDGRYFRGNVANVDAAETLIASGTPVATFTADKVCFGGCGGSIGDATTLSNFLGTGQYSNLSSDVSDLSFSVMELTGLLNIDTADTYRLWLGSDDGARLYVDGSAVVTRYYPTGFSWSSGDVALSAGAHTLRIVYFENGGNTGLSAMLGDDYLAGDLISTAAVPEPASWALMVGGFGLAGAALRGSRRTSARFA